eukprot:scaffold34795_cov112-Isochrysis_galbana.AAC.3
MLPWTGSIPPRTPPRHRPPPLSRRRIASSAAAAAATTPWPALPVSPRALSRWAREASTRAANASMESSAARTGLRPSTVASATLRDAGPTDGPGTTNSETGTTNSCMGSRSWSGGRVPVPFPTPFDAHASCSLSRACARCRAPTAALPARRASSACTAAACAALARAS